MKTNTFAHMAKLSAFTSFGIGTLLFLTFLITNFEGLLAIGFTYLIIAVIINLILFVILLLRVILIKEDRVEIMKNTFLMLINIPIAYVYAHIVFLK